jgi:Methyltransferase FkbM domain
MITICVECNNQFFIGQIVIDLLKLDIEGYEWSAIENMLQSGILSKNVRQLAIEVHFGSGRSSHSELVKQWNLLLALEKAGFRRWSYSVNSLATAYKEHNKLYRIAQHDLVYINLNFARPP